MPEIVVVGTIFLVLALAIGLVAAGTGRRGMAGAGVLVAVVVTGLAMGVVVPSDALHLAEYAGLRVDVMTLVGWGLFAALVRAAGRPKLPAFAPPIAVAVLAGALMGELGAAAVLGAAATSRAAAARLAMAAAGGALIGRFGDPALLVLAPRVGDAVWMLAPLGLLCAMVAWPMRGDLSTTQPPTPAEHPKTAPPASWAVTAVAVVVGLLAQVPGLVLPALAAGALALGGLGARRLRHAEWSSLVHTVAIAGVVLVLVAAGVPGLIAFLLEDSQTSYGHLLRPAMLGASWLASMGLDSAGAGLLGAATLDRAQSLQIDGVPLAIAAGAAVGGLGPLVVVGAVKEGWKILVAQSIIVLGVVLILF